MDAFSLLVGISTIIFGVQLILVRNKLGEIASKRYKKHGFKGETLTLKVASAKKKILLNASLFLIIGIIYIFLGIR